jgi:hypothetical protein
VFFEKLVIFGRKTRFRAGSTAPFRSRHGMKSRVINCRLRVGSVCLPYTGGHVAASLQSRFCRISALPNR